MNDAKPLGEGRDQDILYRHAVAKWIETIVVEFAPDALRLTTKNSLTIQKKSLELVLSRLSA